MSRSADRNAAILRLAAAAEIGDSTPISGRTGADCCARAARGHAAAPPSSVMNWRRLVSSMVSSPEPAVPAYRRLSMLRKRPQVLGEDMNRSESRRRAALKVPPPDRGRHCRPRQELAAGPGSKASIQYLHRKGTKGPLHYQEIDEKTNWARRHEQHCLAAIEMLDH